jgi:uncharacterized protein (TIGR02996 family)
MRRAELHPGLAERLLADPEDTVAIGILADWLEEQGAADEAAWLQDHLHGMAGVFRDFSRPAVDLLGGVDPRWLGLQHGLIRTFRIPSGFDRHAEHTCRRLAELPLALGLVAAHAPDGRSARAWLPQLAAHVPQIRQLTLAADVPPVLAADFDELRVLRMTALAFAFRDDAALPGLDTLSLDVRGGRLDILDTLRCDRVAWLELTAASWSDVDHGPLVSFVERTRVAGLQMEGRGSFAFRQPLREAGLVFEGEADVGVPIATWSAPEPSDRS